MTVQFVEPEYALEGIDAIDTPVLLIYPERVKANIRKLISMVSHISQLRPHIKTCKSIPPVRLMLDAGIRKFKCATIAEAEMLAMAGAKDVLLAYQPLKAKVQRFINLQKAYPEVSFSCLADHLTAAAALAAASLSAGIQSTIFLDLNVGMNRTGIIPGKAAFELYQLAAALPGLKLAGLHAYDGHIHDEDLELRRIKCDAAFKPVHALRQTIAAAGLPYPVLVAGGTPTFPIHARQDDLECSPGTFIYWDAGYAQAFREQDFAVAAFLLSRIISLPVQDRLCLDLGHKAVASENVLSKRVHLLNAPGMAIVGHSEEHLMAEVPGGHQYKPGDVIWAVPYHICPTVALYENALIANETKVTGNWETIARKRKINY